MRIAVFVDVQNVYYTAREAFGRQFNYRALWDSLKQEGEIVAAFAYATDRGDASQRRFQAALRHIGFEVKLKPFIQRRDGSAKGDWDVGITIDVLDVAPSVDRVVLLSGDGDFAMLLDTIKARHQVDCEVYGVRALTAEALIRAADRFHPIESELLQ
jgi:uncharacterized LabA/DUF88 family protein